MLESHEAPPIKVWWSMWIWGWNLRCSTYTHPFYPFEPSPWCPVLILILRVLSVCFWCLIIVPKEGSLTLKLMFNILWYDWVWPLSIFIFVFIIFMTILLFSLVLLDHVRVLLTYCLVALEDVAIYGESMNDWPVWCFVSWPLKCSLPHVLQKTSHRFVFSDRDPKTSLIFWELQNFSFFNQVIFSITRTNVVYDPTVAAAAWGR